MWWEVGKVRNTGKMFAILGIFLQLGFELIQGRNTKVVHVGSVWLSNGVQDKPEAESQMHKVPEGRINNIITTHE